MVHLDVPSLLFPSFPTPNLSLPVIHTHTHTHTHNAGDIQMVTTLPYTPYLPNNVLLNYHPWVSCMSSIYLITFSWIHWLFIQCPTHVKHSARSPNLRSTYLSYGAHLQMFFLISLIQQVLTKPQTIQISFNQWHRTRLLLFFSSFQVSQSFSKCLILLWILLHNWMHLSVTATYRASKFLPGTKVVTGDGKQIRDNPYPWRTQHFRRWL